MEELGMGATSIWILCKAVGLDKNLARICLYGKDDQGGHTNVTVKSETKLLKKKRRYLSCVCGFVSWHVYHVRMFLRGAVCRWAI